MNRLEYTIIQYNLYGISKRRMAVVKTAKLLSEFIFQGNFIHAVYKLQRNCWHRDIVLVTILVEFTLHMFKIIRIIEININIIKTTIFVNVNMNQNKILFFTYFNLPYIFP